MGFAIFFVFGLVKKPRVGFLGTRHITNGGSVVQQQCSEASHICCKEFLQNDPEIVDRLAASALQNVESFEKPDDVSLETGKFFSIH